MYRVTRISIFRRNEKLFEDSQEVGAPCEILEMINKNIKIIILTVIKKNRSIDDYANTKNPTHSTFII